MNREATLPSVDSISPSILKDDLFKWVLRMWISTAMCDWNKSRTLAPPEEQVQLSKYTFLKDLEVVLKGMFCSSTLNANKNDPIEMFCRHVSSQERINVFSSEAYKSVVDVLLSIELSVMISSVVHQDINKS